MSILTAMLRKKAPEPVYSPEPDITHEMPVRPYTLLHELLPFYSDPECRNEVKNARLAIVRSDDPRQTHHPVECMPTRKNYEKGQTLVWDINHKLQWDEAWYVNPDTGNKEKAWARAVEFIGKVVKS